MQLQWKHPSDHRDNSPVSLVEAIAREANLFHDGHIPVLNYEYERLAKIVELILDWLPSNQRKEICESVLPLWEPPPNG